MSLAQTIQEKNNIIQFPITHVVTDTNNKNTNGVSCVVEENTFIAKKPILDKEYLTTSNSKKGKKKYGVQAIPSDYINMIKEYFHKPSRYKALNLRNYAYFVLEINIARRAGDALSLKIQDVMNEDGTLKSHIIFGKEQKTGKRAKIFFNTEAKKAIVEFLNTKESYCMSDYLFQNYKTGENITVDGMRKVIKRMAKALNIDVNLATHSLRKAFIAEAIKNNPNNARIELLASRALNHSNVETTYAYMGFTQNEMDKFFEDNAL